jgi:hypothetical protein
MPDIKMCRNGEKCRKAKTCYRFNATPDGWQSYSKFYKKGRECEDYWNDKQEDRKVDDFIKMLVRN